VCRDSLPGDNYDEKMQSRHPRRFKEEKEGEDSEGTHPTPDVDETTPEDAKPDSSAKDQNLNNHHYTLWKIVVNRVKSATALDERYAQAHALTFATDQLTPSVDELHLALDTVAKVHWRSVCAHLPCFAKYAELANETLPFQYSEEMKRKSQMMIYVRAHLTLL